MLLQSAWILIHVCRQACYSGGPIGTTTHLEKLVRRLLVLLGHGAWAALAQGADGGEHGEGDGNADGGVAEHLPALAWGWEGTRAVGAEGDPVSCDGTVSALSLFRWTPACTAHGAPPGRHGHRAHTARGPATEELVSQQPRKGLDSPAFFSCSVISAQLDFMRSRRAIHRSACSCGGMASHRFSMLARVGVEMAWAARRAAGRTMVDRDAAARAREAGVRSILRGSVMVVMGSGRRWGWWMREVRG